MSLPIVEGEVDEVYRSGVDIPVKGQDQEVATCSRSCKLSMCDGKMVQISYV